MIDKAKPVIAYVDGSCQNNPGPGGWGVYLKYGTAEKELFGSHKDTTNNRMEITAAIEALKSLTRPVYVIIHTDSQYVVNAMTKWIYGWKTTNYKNNEVKNSELWKQLDELCQVHTVEWKWVKGHCGNVGNERADLLARKGTILAIKENKNV